VVKVGSQVLCGPDGRLDLAVFADLARGLSDLRQGGRSVVLVSSGAVAGGRGATGQTPGATDAGTGRLGKQALAAVGQPLLMSYYREALARHQVPVAQVLLTHEDLDDRQRFLRARLVMDELLEAGILPIVNENDTVAVEEIRFGDNDALAAQVSHLVGAEALILLTEVDGLFTTDPHRDPAARRLDAVASRDEAALEISRQGTSRLGTGGMQSKVLAARQAGEMGVITLVASGRQAGRLPDLLGDPSHGTIFVPPARRMHSRRRWIFSSARLRGTVTIDEGAARALRDGGSLLPVGVIAVQGRFDVGDAVRVVRADGKGLGRGLSRYSSEDARRIAGLHTRQIAPLLGWLPARELVHRDDFAAD
jgi:glutamate 5-kinase